MGQDLWNKLFVQIICIVLGITFYKKKSVSESGFIALLFICALFIWLGYIELLGILFGMFASSTYLTKYKKHRKKEFEEVVARTGPRDFKQAFANLGVAIFCMLLLHLTHQAYFLAAFIGSVCTANADSWASEIGGLSTSRPVLITNFKPVEKGISGGITLLGTIGGIAGSFFISSIAYPALLLSDLSNLLTMSFLAIATISGIAGFVFDSYLGATVQVLYKDVKAGKYTEAAFPHNKIFKGFRLINNDMVNLLSTIFGAILAGSLYYIIHE